MLAGAVLPVATLLILAVLGAGRLLAVTAVHARSALLGRVVLLRVAVLAGLVLLSLPVLGIGRLLASAAVQVLAALLTGAVLLFPVLADAVLARRELPVAGRLLRLLVLACPVLAGLVLAGPYRAVAFWPAPDWSPATFCSAAMN